MLPWKITVHEEANGNVMYSAPFQINTRKNVG